MRLLRRPELRLLVLVAIGVAAWLTVRSSHTPPAATPPVEPASWRGLVGASNPSVDVGGRMIVVLRTPSVAQRLARTRLASEGAERRWAAEAFAAQQQVLTQLARHGLSIRPYYSFARVIDGFSATLEPSAVVLLEHNPEVAGVYPVRAAYPAAVSTAAIHGATAAVGPAGGLPGIDGTGITIALLDTGVDLAHPYLHGRVQPGIDVVGGTGTAAAQQDPQARSRVEKHGTELAGILVGSGGPDGAHGVAPGATVLPIRVAGWQRTAGGRDAVYGLSDQLIAGLDRAVDPNGDGDTHDAARVALIGEAEPFASFADSPEALAVEGALELDTLVVAPAGNDGSAGPLYGSIAGPAGSAGALAVGATDVRAATSAVRVVLTQGLDVLGDASLPLIDQSPPAHPIDAAVAVPGDPGALTGKAALVPAGSRLPATVVSAVNDGAVAVLVYGRALPSGALGDLGVPVVSVPESLARAALTAIRKRFTVEAAVGHATSEPNPASGLVASFSSRGLSFGGLLEPQLSAPGVGVATSDPGSAGDGEPAFAAVTGTSASAAAVAGAAALLAEARPGLSAADLASLLAGSARQAGGAPTAGGAGVVDVGASTVGEVTASATSLGFGPWSGRRWHETRDVVLHDVSTRRLVLTLSTSSTLVAVKPSKVVLAPGATATVKVTARASSRPALAVVTGLISVRPSGGPALRIPWAVGFRPPAGPLLGRVRLSPTLFAPSDSDPATLRVVAGRIFGNAKVELEPVSRLDVLLYTASGAFLGVLAREHDLLPGVYSFGITGRSAAGATLAAGSYELRIVAYPAEQGVPSRARVAFRIE